jgi:hypothetical protein
MLQSATSVIVHVLLFMASLYLSSISFALLEIDTASGIMLGIFTTLGVIASAYFLLTAIEDIVERLGF